MGLDLGFLVGLSLVKGIIGSDPNFLTGSLLLVACVLESLRLTLDLYNGLNVLCGIVAPELLLEAIREGNNPSSVLK